MRADGKIVKTGVSPIERAIPYVMPKRVDSQNFCTEYFDEEVIKDYIADVRREKGVHLSRMAVVIAAYHQAAMKYPYINRFVIASKIYMRNHFCVSFVMMKKDTEGNVIQTTIKLFLEPEDTVVTINEKINKLVEENSQPVAKNNTDKFVNFMLSLPLLPTLILNLARVLDHLGLLPRFIIDLSPFHTSMFITNLASINAPHIHHHIYEFGTTSVFLSMGKSMPNFLEADPKKKLMPIGVVMDERICSGHDYTVFNKAFRRLLTHPETIL